MPLKVDFILYFYYLNNTWKSNVIFLKLTKYFGSYFKAMTACLKAYKYSGFPQRLENENGHGKVIENAKLAKSLILNSIRYRLPHGVQYDALGSLH